MGGSGSGSDEGTYWARVRRILGMMDIRTALVPDAQVDAAVALLAAAAEEPSPSASAAEPAEEAQQQLAWARRVRDAAVHPDTGDKIPRPLRLCFIVPCNLVLDTLMLSARGRAPTVAAQWLNQSYNSLHYYANRNASNFEGARRTAEAYVGATASAVGAAVGLNGLLDRAPPRWAGVARRLVPFCAVAAADVLNLGITRRDEVLQGIKVFDANGDELGRSRDAGRRAVGACIAGRVMAAAPVLVVPPLIMHRLEATELYTRRAYLKTPTLMALIAVSIQVAVPLVFGIFKQQASVDVRRLEPEFHNRIDRFGQPVRFVHYNKGL